MDDITPDTFFDLVKSLSPKGRDELLTLLRTAALQGSPADGDVLARMADVLEMLLG